LRAKACGECADLPAAEDTFVSPITPKGDNDVFKFNTKRHTAAIVAVAVAAIAGASAYAFTASNTLADHYAGAATAQVSGYTVSPVSYTFSADGTTVNSVIFTLDAAAADVKVALTAATPVHNDWLDCGASVDVTGPPATHTVTCTFGTPVADGSADNLSVAAVSTGSVVIAP
jgi:hypothetical protein